MNVFDGKILKYSSAALYILLSFISFYCACYRLPVSIKYAINFVVLGWACLVFFIRPQFDRALFCLRMLAIFFFPYLLFWMCSVGIWISEFQTFSYILRGSLNIFYMFTNILYVCGAFYLFDSDVMFYTVVGMAMANSLVALQTAASFGIGTFIAEYIRLLATFADDTGGAMRTMELHDMVYGWGACVIFYFIHKGKSKWKWFICFFFSMLYFTMGFKRIAVPAVAAAVMLYYALYHFKPKHLHAISTLAALLMASAIFFYLYLIKSGIFVEMANELGINLMYRDILYTYFSNFYELAPTFFGKGVRWIYNYTTTDPSYHLATTAVHNVYMELYIEVGFWCWWIWLLYELAFRVHRIDERYGDKPAYAFMAMNFYVFFTYLTDNTSFYFAINILYRMALMQICYESMEQSGIAFAERLSTDEIQDFRREIQQEKEERNWHP